jgi:hypothetical protein
MSTPEMGSWKLETGSWLGIRDAQIRNRSGIRNSKSGICFLRLGFVSLGLILATLSPSVAHATTLVRLSLEQLSQASTAIIRGRVVSQESHWNDTHTQIVTLTSVRVDRVLKGQPASTVVIEQQGGAVGRIHVHVPGTARLLPQGDYLLFLEPAPTNPARHLLVGMLQGSYRIYRDSSTMEERIIQPVGGFSERVYGLTRADLSARPVPAAN